MTEVSLRRRPAVERLEFIADRIEAGDGRYTGSAVPVLRVLADDLAETLADHAACAAILGAFARAGCLDQCLIWRVRDGRVLFSADCSDHVRVGVCGCRADRAWRSAAAGVLRGGSREGERGRAPRGVVRGPQARHAADAPLAGAVRGCGAGLFEAAGPERTRESEG